MLVAGIILLASAIPTILSTVNQINELGWTDFSTIPEKAELLVKLILQGIYIPFGITALIGAIRGKLSFKLFVYALIIVIAIIFYIVISVKIGKISEFSNIIQIILGIGVPIMYVLGTIFVTLGRR